MEANKKKLKASDVYSDDSGSDSDSDSSTNKRSGKRYPSKRPSTSSSSSSSDSDVSFISLFANIQSSSLFNIQTMTFIFTGKAGKRSQIEENIICDNERATATDTSISPQTRKMGSHSIFQTCSGWLFCSNRHRNAQFQISLSHCWNHRRVRNWQSLPIGSYTYQQRSSSKTWCSREGLSFRIRQQPGKQKDHVTLLDFVKCFRIFFLKIPLELLSSNCWLFYRISQILNSKNGAMTVSLREPLLPPLKILRKSWTILRMLAISSSRKKMSRR